LGGDAVSEMVRGTKIPMKKNIDLNKTASFATSTNPSNHDAFCTFFRSPSSGIA
jgi:hypothetical protein